MSPLRRNLRLATLALCGALLASPTGAAESEPVPTVGPVPFWVSPTVIPPAEKANSAPVQILVQSQQAHLTANGVSQFIETAILAQNAAGLQAVGTITIPWNAERSDLVINSVELLRGGKAIDLVKDGHFLVLRRESNLEMATLDGIRTVVVNASGLEVGDVVHVAATFTPKAGRVAFQPEIIFQWSAPINIRQARRIAVVDDGIIVKLQKSPSIPAPKITRGHGRTSYDFTATDLLSPKLPADVPSKSINSLIEITAYRDWQQAADVLRPLFDAARKSAPGSPVLTEADRIAATTADPGQRALAALRLTQEKVRYVALGLGEGAYMPSSADETWSRRFGDCKGKTALLLALLDRLGIVAEPMLTNASASALLEGIEPSLELFDHVAVRAHLPSGDVILDGTSYGQRTLDDLRQTSLEYGLPLLPNTSLIAIPRQRPNAPLSETALEWDATKGFDGKVPFTAKIVIRGTDAAAYRTIEAASGNSDVLVKLLKATISQVADNDLILVGKPADAADGSFVASFSGKADMEWRHKAGIPGRSFEFDTTTIAWDANFGRDSGPAKGMPVILPFPRWIRTREIVLLPNGGAKFKLVAPEINQTVAGTLLHRTGSQTGNRVELISDFRRIQDRISAAEATAATAILAKTNKDVARIDAPENYSATRDEARAIVGDGASDYAGLIEHARTYMDGYQYKLALAELGKASKLDAHRPEAPALTAITYFQQKRYAEARASLAIAQAIESEDWDVLRAGVYLAVRDHDFDQATKNLTTLIELDPDSEEFLIRRAEINASRGRFEEALADARKGSMIAGSDKYLSFEAMIQAAQGKLDLALATITDALAATQGPKAGFRHTRGSILFAMGRSDEAKNEYRLAFAEMNAEIRGHAPANAETSLLPRLMLMTRQFAALDAWTAQRIKQKTFASAPELGFRALAKLMLGDVAVATKTAREAAGLDPSNAEALAALAFAALKQKDYAAAEGHFSAILKASDTSPVALYGRGLARLAMGNKDAGKRDIETAREGDFSIALNPDWIEFAPPGINPRSPLSPPH